MARRIHDLARTVGLRNQPLVPEWARAIRAELAARDEPWRVIVCRVSGAWQRRFVVNRGVGLIGYPSVEDLAVVRELNVPVVNHTTHLSDRLPSVITDHEAIGRVAAEHLLDRHFTRFAYVRFDTQRRLDGRGRGFVDALREAGHDCPAIDYTVHEFPDALRGERKPIAVLAADDSCALRLIEEAQLNGVQVPEQLAVVGVNNDEHLCDFADVPLTSVDVDMPSMGRQAVALLLRLLDGGRAPKRPILVPPRGVVARRSTDVTAPDDPDLNRALQYIRDNACRGMRIADIMPDIHGSRRTLERRFRERFGRSMLDEVRRLQLQRAVHLLTGSRLSIGEIANRCGFARHSRFTDFFTKAAGETPSHYRRKRRSSDLRSG